MIVGPGRQAPTLWCCRRRGSDRGGSDVRILHHESGGRTMMSVRCRLLSGLLVLSGVFAGTARGEQATPLDTLTDRGLTRAGKYFVVAGEVGVLQEVYNMRPLMADMEAKFRVWAAILQNEYEWQNLTDYGLWLGGHITDVNQQIGQMPQRSPLERLALAEAQRYRQRVDQEIRDTNTAIAQRQKR